FHPGHRARKHQAVSSSSNTAAAMERQPLFINNAFKPAASGAWFETVDPSTEQVLTEVARGDAADVDHAVRAADAARRGPWREMPPAARGQLLFKLADAIAADVETLARLETLDVGKPLKESKGDVGGVCGTIRYNAGAADKMEGATIPLGPNFVDF